VLPSAAQRGPTKPLVIPILGLTRFSSTDPAACLWTGSLPDEI